MAKEPMGWSHPPAPIAARLEHAVELSLIGLADLAYWTDLLAPAGLVPTVVDGRSEILICSVAGRFAGIAFREASVSIFLTQSAGGGTRDASLMLCGWNSVRLFSFVERWFFHTPYRHGQVQIDGRFPFQMQVRRGKALRAAMSVGEASRERLPLAFGPDGWQGPIYLPKRSTCLESDRLFFASISGETKTFPFLPGQDTFHCHAESDPELRSLVESAFEPTEWVVRPDATHVKTRTVRRGTIALTQNG